MGARAEEHSFKTKRRVTQCHTALLLGSQAYLHLCGSLSRGRCRGNSPVWQPRLVSCLSFAVSKGLPMLLLFHTLLPSEILDKHHLSTPGNYCACFSLAVQSCCRRGFAVCRGFVRMASHHRLLPCLKWQQLVEERALTQGQEQLQFLRTLHFEGRKYFEMLFLFPCWGRVFPEEMV